MRYKISGRPFKLSAGWIVDVHVRVKNIKTREDARELTKIIKESMKDYNVIYSWQTKFDMKMAGVKR